MSSIAWSCVARDGIILAEAGSDDGKGNVIRTAQKISVSTEREIRLLFLIHPQDLHDQLTLIASLAGNETHMWMGKNLSFFEECTVSWYKISFTRGS